MLYHSMVEYIEQLPKDFIKHIDEGLKVRQFTKIYT
jgi:hypothetical protein